jgi:adenosine deaminase
MRNPRFVEDSQGRGLRRLPKAHLHLHLEGAMRRATLAELCERNGTPQPDPPDGTFPTFIRLYRAAADALRSANDYRRLVNEVVEDAMQDGAVWLEPAEWISPTLPERLGLPHAEAVLQALLEALEDAARTNGIQAGLMVSTNRTRDPAEAVELAKVAARYAGRGVVAFGLADDETRGRPALFAEAFGIARAAGLISAPHAGEHGGPDSVRQALDALGAQRIQHGVRCIEDPLLVRRLVDDAICLDVCPTSNSQLGVVQSLEDHPLPELLQAGLAVSLNADDPLFFGSGLLAEYELSRTTLGLDDSALARIAAASIRHSGAPPSLKARAHEGIEAWLGAAPKR